MTTDSSFTPKSLVSFGVCPGAFRACRQRRDPGAKSQDGPDGAANHNGGNRSGSRVPILAATSENAAGADIFIGMNPIKDGAVQPDEGQYPGIFAISISTSTRMADEALEAIRNSPEVPAPNFVLDTSPGKHQVVWKVKV